MAPQKLIHSMDHYSGCKEKNHQAGELPEFWPLSGKPHFEVILAKSHVKAFCLLVPAYILSRLPSADAPVVLTYRGKTWKMKYLTSDRTQKKFDQRWKEFVLDNHLKVGDACLFEVTNSCDTLVEMRVQIFRGDIPRCLSDRTCGVQVYMSTADSGGLS